MANVLAIAFLLARCGVHADPALHRIGDDPTVLNVCEGDCDVDGDCPGASVCTERVGGVPADVAGCTVGDSEGDNAEIDYCTNPTYENMETDKISNYAQGARWSDKCILISDWNSKDYDDDIHVIARNSTTGCCPEGFIPGVEATAAGSYISGQVVCGIGSDGTQTAFSRSTSNGVTTCNYGQCYVIKNVMDCTGEDSKININGCCHATGGTASTLTFPELCLGYFHRTVDDQMDNTAKYCLTYNKTYALHGTADETDDVVDEMLVLNGLKYSDANAKGYYYYTPCLESGIPGVPMNPTPAPTPTKKGGADMAQGQEAPGALALAFGTALLFQW